MILLGIYLGATALSIGTTTIYILAFVEKMKRKGYEIKKSESSKAEKILNCLKMGIFWTCPIIHLSAPVLIFVAQDRLDEEYEKVLLDNGSLIKTTPSDKQEIISPEPPKKEKEINNSPKKEMTREEQLRFLRNERELFGKNTSKQKGQVLEIKPKFKNNQK